MSLFISILLVLLGLALLYGWLSFVVSILVQELPRRPVNDYPDWGRVTDTTISTVGEGRLEVWRIEPDRPSRGIVVLAHGWGRNRDRMVKRARYFGHLGFTCILHSARDHGHSTPKWFMNANRFAEDIEAVLNWVDEKVILYGHSAGSAGAIVAAARNPNRIRLLFLEASYSYTEPALLNLYRWFNPSFGRIFGPAILFWFNRFYHQGLDRVSPARLAASIECPVMLIHGEKDGRFPVYFAHALHRAFKPGQATLFIAPQAHHSDSSASSGYGPAVADFLNRNLSSGLS